MIATTGGSAQKPSAVAVLMLNSVDELLKSEPEDWETVKLSTKSEVCCVALRYAALRCAVLCCAEYVDNVHSTVASLVVCNTSQSVSTPANPFMDGVHVS